MEESRSSKVELIKHAIKQLMDELDGDDGPTISSSDDDNRRRRLLSKLMSQLEMLEDESEAYSKLTKAKSKVSSSREKEDDDDDDDKIVKELKKVRRQNVITHCLLSAMIVLTVVWQVSEVSIILKLKNGFTNPFRSLGSIFKGVIKPPKTKGYGEDTESPSVVTSNLIESSPVHDFKMPELPCIELPKIDFGFNGED
uniref:uncharacterized protein LOC122594932 n=1 Tax=Erigeron canadensis TaxID=72917 RepID=UPI001CB98321|nr:uncharacterized protein LOC122594932 [Erigeron canadensis]